MERQKLPFAANLLAIVITLGFLGVIAAKLYLRIVGNAGADPALDYLVGVLCSAEILVLAFYFSGSVSIPVLPAPVAAGGPAVVPAPIPAVPAVPAPVVVPPVVTPPPVATPPVVAPPVPVSPVILPARYKEIRGKVSWFGGPNDKESGNDAEGVAIYDSASQRPELFLPSGPGLFQRLNTEIALYCAARWDYHETPKQWLRENQCLLTNPVNGKSVKVWPADWGPNVRTGRAIDVSHAALLQLGLETDAQAILRVPLPGGVSAPVSPLPAPAPRAHPTILSDAKLKATFGDFHYTEGSGGRITIDPEWVKAHIVEAHVPQLVRLGVRDGKVECHRLVEAALVAAWAEVEAAGLLGALLTFDGLWVARHMTWNPARPLSRHSWGIAFDVNAGFNGYNTAGARQGAHGSLWEVAPIFESHGFAWGERWSSAKDPMHFEYAVA